jgi:hypothetical protein
MRTVVGLCESGSGTRRAEDLKPKRDTATQEDEDKVSSTDFDPRP